MVVGPGTSIAGLAHHYQTQEAMGYKTDLAFRPQSTSEMNLESRSNLRILDGEATINDYKVVLAATRNRLNRLTYQPQVEKDFLIERVKGDTISILGTISYAIGGVWLVSRLFRNRPLPTPKVA